MDLSLDGIEGKIVKHADVLAFLYQLTEKDLRYASAQSYWKNYTFQEKLKVFADIVAGRTVGYSPFPDYANYPATFNLGNAINKTSMLGGLLWGAGEVGLVSEKWGNVGKKVLIGGALGGVFDAPGGAPGSQASANPLYQPGPGAQAPAMGARPGAYFNK